MKRTFRFDRKDYPGIQVDTKEGHVDLTLCENPDEFAEPVTTVVFFKAWKDSVEDALAALSGTVDGQRERLDSLQKHNTELRRQNHEGRRLITTLADAVKKLPAICAAIERHYGVNQAADQANMKAQDVSVEREPIYRQGSNNQGPEALMALLDQAEKVLFDLVLSDRPVSCSEVTRAAREYVRLLGRARAPFETRQSESLVSKAIEQDRRERIERSARIEGVDLKEALGAREATDAEARELRQMRERIHAEDVQRMQSAGQSPASPGRS